MPTIAFKSLGCKLNQYENQALLEGFKRYGFHEVPPTESSDFYILNTCTVTEGADKEARYLIRQFNRRNHKAQIIVTGCYAHAAKQELEQLPGVAMVVDNTAKNQIVHKVTGIEETKEEESPFFKHGISSFNSLDKAFVKVQDGCNYFCTFCKIPFVRGRLQSRDERAILQEVERLISAGFEEIILSGVCLGSYGKDTTRERKLVDLIQSILRIPGNFRIRLSSIDPRDTPGALVELMQKSPKLCPHLHLSLQSGSDKILNAMRRGYTREDYRSIVTHAQSLLPYIGITTDVIVGFPGEGEEEFEETREFVQSIGFHHVHFFPYSEREQTKAIHLADKVPSSIIHQRMQRIQNEFSSQLPQTLKRYVSSNLQVLVESGRTKAGSLQGFSENYLKCIFDGPDSLIGRVVTVQAYESCGNKLICRLTH